MILRKESTPTEIAQRHPFGLRGLSREVLFYVDARLLFGHVHSPGAKPLLGFVLG